MRIQSALFALLISFALIGQEPCDEFNADFTWTNTGNGVQFSNGTTGNGISTTWLWSFGDNTGHTVAQPFHTYSQPGTYEVCLTALSIYELPNGEFITCQDIACAFIQVGGDPCSSLETCFVTNDLGNGNFFFDNCTSGPLGTQLFWDFGDGTQSTTTNVDHHFEPGTYIVCLYAYWQNCADTTCTTITVINEDPCADLQAIMTWIPGEDNTIQFVGTTNLPVDGFVWDFGDGQEGYNLSELHTYSTPGEYFVCFSAYLWNAQTQDTCWVEHCNSVVVGMSDPCDFLQACFQPSPAGTNAFFFNNCTADQPGTQFEWDFGDGTSSGVLAPTHTYTAPATYTVCLWATWQNCADSTCQTVTVDGGDTCLGLNADFSSFTTPNGTQFSNGTTGAGIQTSFSWTFGDGSTSTDAQPFHTYSTPGSYEACLQVLTYFELAGGGLYTCVDTTCNTVIIGGGDPCDDLEACFVINDLGNGTYFFDNCTSGPSGTQLSWDFGDGAQSTLTNVEHHFDPGTYTVCLYAYWQNCVDTTCTTITVLGDSPCDSLNANFVWSSGNNAVNFANEVIDLTWTYYWQFGDGTTANGPNPYHTYPGSGTYETCLTVWTWDPVAQDTCFQVHCELVVLNGNEPCDFLQACFQPTLWGTNAYFFNNCTPNKQGTQYEWDFGDGTTSNLIAPTHIYTSPGTYTVCLWATWQNCADSTCQTVTVDGGDPCLGLNADFSAFTTPNGTQFSNGTTGAGIQTSFSWTFGDGSTSTDAQPFHTYSTPGSYEACLQVLTYFELAGGGLHTCIDTTCNTVIIGGGNPCDDVQVCYVTNLLPNNGVFLDNCSSGPADMQFAWSFGDGNSSTVENAEHHYGLPGTYEVCLIVYTLECADTLCTNVVIEGSSDCNGFTASFEVEVTGTAVVFYGQSSLPADGMSWSFGDGTYGEGSPVTHLYEPPGPYEVCLDSWYWNENTQDSCYAQSCQTIDPFHVGIGPVVASDAINIYPQPAHDRLTITGAALSTPMHARLFGMDGKLEQQEQVNALPHHVDVSTLAPAVHVLQLELEGQRFNYRVVVE